MNKPFEKFFRDHNMTQFEESKRMIGRIFRVSNKGWGFITSQEKMFTRIFFHWTSLEPTTLNFQELKVGMLVEFTATEVPERGWQAFKICVIDLPENDENQIDSPKIEES